MNIEGVATLLAEFFDKHQRRYAAIGGYALVAHGILRATFDMDWVVEDDSQDELVGFLEALGYETLHRSSGYSNHLHPDVDLGRIDFVYVDERTANEIFNSSEKKEILEGVEVLVPRPEHLVAMKVRAIKNDPDRKLQDLADVRALAQLSGVDTEEIRAYFDKLGLAELYEEVKPRD